MNIQQTTRGRKLAVNSFSGPERRVLINGQTDKQTVGVKFDSAAIQSSENVCALHSGRKVLNLRPNPYLRNT